MVAPAGPHDPALLQAGLAVWRQRGFVPVVPDDLNRPRRYLAGTDAQRARLLNEALADETIKAVVCTRGGYGSLRILDALLLEQLRDSPKIFIGFSDITALQTEIWRRCGMVTFSGPMIAGSQLSRMSDDELTVYFSTLTSTAPPPPLTGEHARKIVAGTTRGYLLGGNLTLLCHLAAAGKLPRLRDAILLVEDIHEAPYRLDRMLTALRLGGHLEGIAGVAGGFFGDDLDPDLVAEIFADCLGGLGVPVVLGLDVGHGLKNRLTPLGAPVSLTTDPPAVIFTQSGVC